MNTSKANTQRAVTAIAHACQHHTAAVVEMLPEGYLEVAASDPPGWIFSKIRS
jgi:hypothetical protein